MFKVQFKNTENSRKLIAFYLDAGDPVVLRHDYGTRSQTRSLEALERLERFDTDRILLAIFTLNFEPFDELTAGS